MKNKILFIWIIFHLAFIISSNVLYSYRTYCEYANKKMTPLPVLTNALYSPIANYYGKYSGAETGYGFFGFNVRSNGLFIAECNGKKITPHFHNNESSLRFFSLSSTLTESLLKKNNIESATNDTSLRNRLDDMAIKNIATKLYNENKCDDSSLIISYNLISYPSLTEFRKNKKDEYELTKLKIMKISLF